MVIIEIKADKDGFHNLQGQDGRSENWMGDGWAVVPTEMQQAAFSSCGFCTITVRNGVVTSLVPVARPPAPILEPTPEEERDAMLVDHEYRLAMMELGQ